MSTKIIGVIHGKFQMLHLGHMEYLLAGKNRCDYLYIGITNPDTNLTSDNENDLNRSKLSSNPFTYYERMEMIRDAMLENGVNRTEFEIVPFPINYPKLINNYVPMSAVFFVTIYDKWGEHKLETLNRLGVKTDLMWVRDMSERLTSGTEVRTLIANDGEWTHLVPKSVSTYVKERKLIERIKTLCK